MPVSWLLDSNLFFVLVVWELFEELPELVRRFFVLGDVSRLDTSSLLDFRVFLELDGPGFGDWIVLKLLRQSPNPELCIVALVRPGFSFGSMSSSESSMGIGLSISCRRVWSVWLGMMCLSA